MAPEGLPVERLREFLRDLKPAARALLIAELERGMLRGDEMPGTDIVLQELRRTLRDVEQPPPRVGNPERLFFKSIEPFIVDDEATHRHRGRIARIALAPIWSWICRDLMPEESKTFSDDVAHALLANDNARAEQVTRSFQDQVVGNMQDALDAVAADDKAKRRLSGQIGTPRALEIVNEIAGILKARDALTTIGARMPRHVNALTDPFIEPIKILLDALHGRNPDWLLYGLLLVMSRLAAPWQLVRFATRAADSDKAAKIALNPYAMAVTVVLDEVERLVGELRADLKSGPGVVVIAVLKDIHDAARGLRTELDLSPESAWGRQLAAIRSEISDMLKSEIESMPGRVRRLLRPRPTKEIVPGSALDAGDVAETEALIGFVGACRKYAGELAINEMTQRTFSELQQYLETSTQALIDGVRTAEEGDRRFRQSQVDAAVRFCNKVFGQDYAAMLAKAAEVAAHAERKAAKA